MHLVDISALYSPQGGGIRTYTHRKLEVAEKHGVRLTVVVPTTRACASSLPRCQPSKA